MKQEEEKQESDPVLDFPIAVQRLHKRLNNDVELYKLHVKHYHMPPSQFKRRTSQLGLPQYIYDKYAKIVVARFVLHRKRDLLIHMCQVSAHKTLVISFLSTMVL